MRVLLFEGIGQVHVSAALGHVGVVQRAGAGELGGERLSERLLYHELPGALMQDSLLKGVHVAGVVEQAADWAEGWQRLRQVLNGVLRQKAGLSEAGKVVVLEEAIINGENTLQIAEGLRARGVVDARLMSEIPWGEAATLEDGQTLARVLGGRFSDAAHAYEMGADPGTQWKLVEAVEGLHLELQEGLQLRRWSDNAYEWVAPNGYTYDAIGGFPSQYFNLNSFTNQIRIHLDK